MVRRITSVRELHARMGSSKDFTDWFKYQIESLKLVEGRDYSELSPKKGEYSGIKRGRLAQDFALIAKVI
jgi:phage anti-repressor protein